MNPMKQRILLALAVLVVTTTVIVMSLPPKVGALSKQVPSVTIAVAQEGASQSDVMAQGTAQPSASANVSVLPRFEGQVTQVLVNVGDRVSKGQILAVLDPIYQQAQLRQAEATERSAQANYSLVLHPYRPEEIQRQQSKLDSDIQTVEEAKSELALLRHGRRPQEIEAASAEVAGAKATLAQAVSDLKYAQKLYDKELVAKADLEKSQTVVDVDRSALLAVQAHLNLLNSGSRPEDIAKAEAALKAAQADYQADMQTHRIMLLGSRPEAIEAAAADLARANETINEQKLLLTRQMVRSPIAGIVVERNVNPGEVATPQANRSDNDAPLSDVRHSLFVIADDSSLEFRANVDERFYRSVTVGEQAIVTFESELGKSYIGRVVRMKPLINPETGAKPSPGDAPDLPLTFDIWVSLDNSDNRIVLGETGLVSVQEQTPGIVIPQSAITPFSSGNGVAYVEKDGVINVRAVRYGDVTNGHVRILSGIHDGEHVVVSTAYKLADGMRVHAVESLGSGTAPM